MQNRTVIFRKGFTYPNMEYGTAARLISIVTKDAETLAVVRCTNGSVHEVKISDITII